MTFRSESTFDTSIGTLKILADRDGNTLAAMQAAERTGAVVMIDDAAVFIRAVQRNPDHPGTIGVRVEQAVP